MLNGCKFCFQISCLSYLNHLKSLVFLFSLLCIFYFDPFWYPKCWLRGHAVLYFLDTMKFFPHFHSLLTFCFPNYIIIIIFWILLLRDQEECIDLCFSVYSWFTPGASYDHALIPFIHSNQNLAGNKTMYRASFYQWTRKTMHHLRITLYQ